MGRRGCARRSRQPPCARPPPLGAAAASAACSGGVRGVGAALLRLPSTSLPLPRASEGGAHSLVALPRSLAPRTVSRAAVTAAAAKGPSSGEAISALMQLDIDPQVLCGAGFEWGCDVF